MSRASNLHLSSETDRDMRGTPDFALASAAVSHGSSAHEAGSRLYRQALAQTGEAVVITNSGGVIEYVNAAFETVTGYTADEAIGKRPVILKSGEHDRSFYSRLWGTLGADQGVCLRRKLKEQS